MATIEAITRDRYRFASRRKPAAVATVVFALLLVTSLSGFAAGRRTAQSPATVMTGKFYVGNREATAAVHGRNYTVSDTVWWMDSSGSLHEDGWPACMNQTGSTVEALFSGTRVKGPDSALSFDSVLWVDCRGATKIH